MSKFKCSICGKEFNDIRDYAAHVSECAKDFQKKEAENLQKLNEDLNRVKAAKDYYKDLLAKFKENYPEAYELNFGSKNNKSEVKPNITVNGKKVSEKELKEYENTLNKVYEELTRDPFVDHMIKVLGL